MSSLFTLKPTFTQGLIVGQLSILLLLYFILKYLFLESPSDSDSPEDSPAPLKSTFPYNSHRRAGSERVEATDKEEEWDPEAEPEATEWFNLIVKQVVASYRSELRDNMAGYGGDEAARIRIQEWANKHRNMTLMDSITIHSLELGTSAPRLSNAQMLPPTENGERPIQFDVTYTDSISLSLSTSLKFNLPTPAFARLPISLSLSLSLFSATITLTPPNPESPTPTLTLALPPTFTLNLKATSLLGSRAKLADVPKIHEMIEARIRRFIAERGLWTVSLPGFGKSRQDTTPSDET